MLVATSPVLFRIMEGFPGTGFQEEWVLLYTRAARSGNDFFVWSGTCRQRPANSTLQVTVSPSFAAEYAGRPEPIRSAEVGGKSIALG